MDIKLEDLFVECAECNGTGQLHTVERTGNTIGHIGSEYAGPCKACGGRGGKMTPSGQAIFEFCRRVQLKF